MSNSSPDVQPVRDNNNTGSTSPSCSFFNGCSEGKRFTVLEVIGKGSYGTVCAATDNLTGEKVAIKRIQNVFDNVADATRILREIKLLRLLKHPDVVEIKHIMLPPNPSNFKDIFVVFELMESDLHTVIGANDDLTADHHKVFLYQLLRGLAFIHECGVLHRDLKPKNILANSNCKLKICDFGLARPFLGGDTLNVWTDYVATRWYRAPELCGCFYGCYSQAVDIWSIGCIFAETLLGKPLFPGRDAVTQLQLITDLLGKPTAEVIDNISNPKARNFLHALPNKPHRPFSSKFKNADPGALDLLQQLLAFDPRHRPSAAQALEHPYFQGLPKAAPTEAPLITSAQFEFELHKLTEMDVRNHIYMEALNYHPHVMAQYTVGSCRLSPLASQIDMENDDVRRQFMVVEQYGQGMAPGSQVKQTSYGSHRVMPHQVPAYRPADQVMAAALVAEQQALQAMQYQQQQALQAALPVYDYYSQLTAASGPSVHSHSVAAAQHAAGLYAESSVAYSSGQILVTEC